MRGWGAFTTRSVGRRKFYAPAGFRHEILWRIVRSTRLPPRHRPIAAFARWFLSSFALAILIVAGVSPVAGQSLDLATAKGLSLHNVSAEPATHENKPAVRVT